MLKRLKRYYARHITCPRLGHNVVCQMARRSGTAMTFHKHYCYACNKVFYEETIKDDKPWATDLSATTTIGRYKN
jgi:hypothetical protein